MQTSGDHKSVALIIPVYNGAQYLARTMTVIAEFYRDNPWLTEVIMVDDGSTDATAERLAAYQKEASFPLRVLRHEENAGKGWAIRRGVRAVDPSVTVIAFTDVEIPYGMDVVKEAAEKIENTRVDLVAGNRRYQADMSSQYSPYRRFWTGIFRYLLPAPIRDIPDTQSGVKVFRRAQADEIFSRIRTSRWVFDIEIFLIAKRLGYTVEMLPVDIRPACRAGKGGVSALKHGPRILFDICRINVYDKTNRYME